MTPPELTLLLIGGAVGLSALGDWLAVIYVRAKLGGERAPAEPQTLIDAPLPPTSAAPSTLTMEKRLERVETEQAWVKRVKHEEIGRGINDLQQRVAVLEQKDQP